MKKNYLFITLLVVFSSVNAQITLTSAANTPIVGNTNNYFLDNAPTIFMPQPGPNQTWDYSLAGGTSSPFNYISLANSVEPTTYPGANIVESATGAENYYLSTSASYSILGQLIPGTVRAIFTDKREFLNFPITYPNVFNETFAGTVENIAAGQTFNRSGTNIISASGHGTLILPYATVNNVLMVTVAGSYSDMLGATPVASYEDTIISFYNSTTKALIASYTVLYINGSLTTTQTSYIDQANLVTGIDVTITKKNNVVIYPNPARNIVTIKSTEVLNEISIYSLTGKLVKEITPSFNLSQNVNIEDISKGVYFIKYVDENGTHTKKLIIE